MKQYTIEYGDKQFLASEYQNMIFDNVEHGSGNMTISAAAGAAKSTTIINCIKIIDQKKKVLFIAFNKDIVESIRKKVGDKKNAKISTFHSLGYSILAENMGRVTKSMDFVNEFKYRNYIKKNIDKLTKFGEIGTLGKNKYNYINNIIDLVEYSRYYLAFSTKEIERISRKYGLALCRDEVDVCKEVLKWGKENTNQIDYTDMIWLPNVLNFNTKKYLFNWILIDEAQDTSIAEQQLIKKCFKRGARFIAVMDQFQQINIWAGSSDEAIDNFKNYPNTKEFILPITYRCPKKIVELAKDYSNNIIAADNAIEGEINYDVSINAPSSNDMVLCRTTAPLVDLHLKYMRINKKSYIKGFENIRDNYVSLIKTAYATNIDVNCKTTSGLFTKLYKNLFRQIEIVKKMYGLDEDDAMMHESVYSMYDSIQGIKAIAEGLNTVDELVDKINIVFSGDESDAVQLSTIHKAKGLEADNIYILLPSLMPLKFAKKDWEIKTEKNLIYVAYTRAKKTLNFIKEDKNTFGYINGGYDPSNIRHAIKRIQKQLNFNSKDEIDKKLEKPKKLNEKANVPTITNKVPKGKKNKKKAASKYAKFLR
jgi:DNA helicase II / ATP-dependent DNA helicase PcrA